jgi:Clostridium epsilon toxin ETX/Bacillus mosquitocidal toxin MTX2
MMRVRRIAAIFGALLTGLGLTLVMAQPAAAMPDCDHLPAPPICKDPPPPPPKHAPVLAIDGLQQTTSRSGVHVWGWTADADGPTASLAVSFSIDGSAAGSVTASQPRPDVAAQFPNFGPAHGFDVVLPASSAGHTVCVTAIGVGGGPNNLSCQAMDDIVEFDGYAISYDTDHAILTGTWLEELDKVTNRNDTAVQQSTVISGTKMVADTEGWSDTIGVKVTVSADVHVGIPLLGGTLKVTVEGSYSYTQNSSTTRTQTFSWQQPVLVPARSIVDAAVTVTHATISVAYTMTGDYVYRSGARAGGSVDGVFTGGNSEQLTVSLNQSNLDGTPAAAPVRQPRASLLQVTPNQ